MLNTLINLALSLYDRGVFGGRPKRLLDLGEEAGRLKLAGEQHAAELGQLPVYGYRPAPGEGVATGGITPDIARRISPGTVGPSIAEAGMFGGLLEKGGILDTLKNLPPGSPLKEELARIQLSRIMPQEQIRGAMVGGAYPTPVEQGLQAMETAGKKRGLEYRPSLMDIAVLGGTMQPPSEEQYVSQPPGHGVMSRRTGEYLPGKEPSSYQPSMSAEIQSWKAWSQAPPADVMARVRASGRTEVTFADYKIWEWENRERARVEAIVGKDPDRRLAMEVAKAAVANELAAAMPGSVELTDEMMLDKLMARFHEAYAELKGQKRPERTSTDPFKIKGTK